MVRHVVLDSANQGRHTAKRAATNPLAGDLGEPAFDQIQPVVGTKWRWYRGCASNHASTLGCVWVA